MTCMAFWDIKRSFESLNCNKSFFKCKMAYLESEAVRIIDKFNGEKFSLWKFKMEMVLAFMDF